STKATSAPRPATSAGFSAARVTTGAGVPDPPCPAYAGTPGATVRPKAAATATAPALRTGPPAHRLAAVRMLRDIRKLVSLGGCATSRRPNRPGRREAEPTVGRPLHVPQERCEIVS